MAKKSTDTVINNFIERIGLSVEADGLPRIAGRILGFFVIYGGPVSFADLALRLQVSRGSISTNARLLASLGVIERVGLPGDRQDYYQLTESPYVRLIEGYIKRQKDMKTIVEEVQDEIPTSMKDKRSRLRDLHNFYKAAAENMQRLVDQIDNKK